jgi:DtxR family Mn-dependent transcriptional regulator
LEHERYRTVNLTPKGVQQAAVIRERHSFLTSFLQDLVGVSPETAEKDACKMEHLLSEETLKKMKILMRRKAEA